MLPAAYKMVDMGDIDLAEINGSVVTGIYNKVRNGVNAQGIVILYNWFFASMVIPPAYVYVDMSQTGKLIINGSIQITSDDRIGVIGFIRIPVINPLTVTENGRYDVPEGVDGYDPVTVNIPAPTLVQLTATQNGTFVPVTGQDGFSEVIVNVPEAVLVQLNATHNGTFTPATGQDGFSQVSVNVQPTLTTLSVTENGTYTPGQGVDGFSSVAVDVSGGIPGLEKIEAAYNGAVYGFLSGSTYYGQDTNGYSFAFFDVTPGDYICLMNSNNANRFRYMHYASHSFEDIESIVLSPGSGNNFSGTSPYGQKDSFLEDPIHIEIFSSGCFMVYYYSGYPPALVTEVLLLKENFT